MINIKRKFVRLFAYLYLYRQIQIAKTFISVLNAINIYIKNVSKMCLEDESELCKENYLHLLKKKL